MRLQPHARSMAIWNSLLFWIVEFPYRLNSFELKHFMFHQIVQRNRILGCEWISLCSHLNILRCGGVYATNGVGGAGKFDQNIHSKWGWAPAFVLLNANRRCKRFCVFFSSSVAFDTCGVYCKISSTWMNNKNYKVVAKRSLFGI